MQLYHRIRDLREDNDISQRKAAELFFVSKNTYIRYETGQTVPPLDFLIRIADYYHVSIDWIAERTNKKAVNR